MFHVEHPSHVSQSLGAKLGKLESGEPQASGKSAPASILSPTKWAQNSLGFQPAKVQFVAQRGDFFQNVADVSIAYQIFGTHV